MRTLDLKGNDLSALPAWLSELPLEYLFLDGNDKLGLPPEIIAAATDPKKILDYYFRIAAPDAAQPLNEFKLVLVGRGGVGKTTLVHRLVESEYKEFPETPGIRIAKWPVTIDGEEKRAHVWDFGGQEIMHGTHRFFMTERALYLVLLSRRENLEDRDAEYWLSLVRSFAGEVPVIVLLHKCDSGLIEVNRRLLREKYGESIAFLETDSFTGTGIRELREKICQLAGALPGLQTKWPRAWHQVKEELPGAQKNWMTFEEFCAFCAERGVPERKDQEALAESLHDLGLMLAYRREEALRGFGVLNPQWVTNGIYAVLNAPALKEAGGRFTVDALATVLAEADYPRTLHPYLLALMRKFKLCHPLDDAGTKFLIPELLTKEEPAALDTEFPPAECLGFVYRYETVLPEGLLSRFIVETYVHRAPRHAWRTGVVLEREGCRALIRGDVLGRRIAILVTGSTGGRRVLLGIVREHFERIHGTFEKLPVTELVPIPGAPGVEAEYADLRDYEDAGDDEYKVVINRRPVKQSVQALLDGVDMPGSVRGGSDKAAVFNKLVESEGAKVRVFVSYSHKDAVFLDNLLGHLTPYERSEDLWVWADPLLEPGKQWSDEIFTNLDQADIMILLLSADSLASKFCIEKELARAVERRIEIVPILIRACRYDKDLTLGGIQAILPGGKPVETAGNDAAWVEVTRQLDKVIKRVRERR
ncbi:MAG TPA: COR domain-containing protein [Chthoniobacteraceae bacterium]|nr:COR domain-containing protein [Chthoniobacteraceae bacterium]